MPQGGPKTTILGQVQQASAPGNAPGVSVQILTAEQKAARNPAALGDVVAEVLDAAGNPVPATPAPNAPSEVAAPLASSVPEPPGAVQKGEPSESAAGTAAPPVSTPEVVAAERTAAFESSMMRAMDAAESPPDEVAPGLTEDGKAALERSLMDEAGLTHAQVVIDAKDVRGAASVMHTAGGGLRIVVKARAIEVGAPSGPRVSVVGRS